MTLTVDPPAPPTLAAVDPNEYEDAEVVGDADYRRDELEAFLREGAWEEAFEEWAATSDMDETDWRIVEDLELVSRYDFFWDDFADRVGYHAPGLPEDWKERDLHPEIDSWGTVSAINAGLTELGQVVCEVLKAEYIDWEASYEAPDDLPEFDD
ncbi:hypothetical protein GRS48_06605 [Halorubrum sp. JWXQ-INN 858]|uniref:hypothetical protein n=1 Tax=Halorubrum sp. JWXQ-INN 858 TaxID=2690782 RepID=UPI001358E52A|nr:hypothetical protein [Halorubrum sp. JWXQ-INN 858]MWV64495.1 hypothetical protein [Halorubrum sp. JWXQ-INN 858]